MLFFVQTQFALLPCLLYCTVSCTDGVSAGSKHGPQDRGTMRVKQSTVYNNVAGQVIEADGLKGELGMFCSCCCYNLCNI